VIFYASTNSIRINKAKRIRRMGYHIRNEYKILDTNLKKCVLGGYGLSPKDNIEVDVADLDCKDVDWFQVLEGRLQW
jgi:hypothetical protein